MAGSSGKYRSFLLISHSSVTFSHLFIYSARHRLSIAGVLLSDTVHPTLLKQATQEGARKRIEK